MVDSINSDIVLRVPPVGCKAFVARGVVQKPGGGQRYWKAVALCRTVGVSWGKGGVHRLNGRAAR